MRKLLAVLLTSVFISCGGGGTAGDPKKDSLAPDTSITAPVIITDSTGSERMNADTTGMGQAR